MKTYFHSILFISLPSFLLPPIHSRRQACLWSTDCVLNLVVTPTPTTGLQLTPTTNSPGDSRPWSHLVGSDGAAPCVTCTIFLLILSLCSFSGFQLTFKCNPPWSSTTGDTSLLCQAHEIVWNTTVVFHPFLGGPNFLNLLYKLGCLKIYPRILPSHFMKQV